MSLKVSLKISRWSQTPSMDEVHELQAAASAVRVFGDIAPRKSDSVSYGLVSFNRQITVPSGLEQDIFPKFIELANSIDSSMLANAPYYRSDISYNFVRLTSSNPKFLDILAPQLFDTSSFVGKVKVDVTRGYGSQATTVGSASFNPGCLPDGIVRSAKYRINSTELGFSLKRLAPAGEDIPWDFFKWSGFQDYISVSDDNSVLTVASPNFGNVPSKLIELLAALGGNGSFDFTVAGSSLVIPAKRNSKFTFKLS